MVVLAITLQQFKIFPLTFIDHLWKMLDNNFSSVTLKIGQGHGQPILVMTYFDGHSWSCWIVIIFQTITTFSMNAIQVFNVIQNQFVL